MLKGFYTLHNMKLKTSYQFLFKLKRCIDYSLKSNFTSFDRHFYPTFLSFQHNFNTRIGRHKRPMLNELTFLPFFLEKLSNILMKYYWFKSDVSNNISTLKSPFPQTFKCHKNWLVPNTLLWKNKKNRRNDIYPFS